MNTVTFHVENCLDCPHCYTDRILTADSFEHEEGAYCSRVEDKSISGFGKNGQHKLIGSDDWHLRDCTKVPNWCPLLMSAPGRFCSFSPNRKCRKMAGKGVQPLDNYTCRFCLSSLKQADKSGLDRLQAGKLAGV